MSSDGEASVTRPSKDGRSFEERIHGLLQLHRAQSLTREKQFSSQKADLYFEAEIFGNRRRFAVECKDYSGTLSKEDISQIRCRYEGLFADHDISDLLIVSNHKLSAGAQSYVESVGSISYQTEGDLRNSVIDFKPYLAGLRARFENEDVRHYQVPAQGSLLDSEGKVVSETPNKEWPDLRQLLIHRLGLHESPIVVLGAYGIGKTTLARQIFLDLAERLDRDLGSTIPIYIPLDLMQGEQSLEGLLGTLFTSIAPCPGYNFDLFLTLNRQGHFTLLLDGIDEMRHKLTKEDFLYNIDQLARLSRDNPSTILLGRPSAFMDEDEYHYVVHGHRGDHHGIKLAGHTGYEEIHLSLLKKNDVSRFVDRFCAWKFPKETRYPAKVMDVIYQEGHRVLSDIAQRPIQLMMILEIFPQLPKKLEKVTKATIYSLFVDQLIIREKQEKKSRLFSKEDQRAFARSIAWWLWIQGGKTRVEAVQIDPNVFIPFLRPGEAVEDIRRALVSGSFLSTEGGNRLHFPHRSIQEYFVGEQLCLALNPGRRLEETFPTLSDKFDVVLTPEVADFLCAQLAPDQVPILLSYCDRIRAFPQSVTALTQGGEAIERAVTNYLARSGSPTAAWVCVYSQIRERSDLKNEKDFDLISRLTSLISERVDRYSRDETFTAEEAFNDVATYILCLFVLSSSPRGSYSATSGAFLPTIVKSLLAFGKVESKISDKVRRQGKHNSFKIHPYAFGFLERMNASVLSDRIDIQWVYKFLRARAMSAPLIVEWVVGETLRVPNVKLRTHFNTRDLHSVEDFRNALREVRAKFPIEA